MLQEEYKYVEVRKGLKYLFLHDLNVGRPIAQTIDNIVNVCYFHSRLLLGSQLSKIESVELYRPLSVTCSVAQRSNECVAH